MDRKHFLKSVLLTTGGVLLGGTTIYRCLNSKETTDTSLPSLIDKTHQGNMKKILVIMSAGTKRGNTDRLTDAYIKGLVERGHSVTKVYLGSIADRRVPGMWSLSASCTSVYCSRRQAGYISFVCGM